MKTDFLLDDPNDKFPPFVEPKTHDGKTAYDVLREHPECPFRLPSARSMTRRQSLIIDRILQE